jgi:hypothetical protein
MALQYSVQPVGLPDPAAANPNGYFSNQVVSLNDAGDVVGTAANAVDSDQQQAWIYQSSAQTTIEIGLLTGAYDAFGFTHNDVESLCPDGEVVGIATRYDANELGYNNGSDAWVYSPTTGKTQLIGLGDPAHVRADGYSTNRPYYWNASGQVAGMSERYGSVSAEDSWFYEPTTQSTYTIGLFDAVHTATTGAYMNSLVAMAENGEVAGEAFRYSGNTAVTTDAWAYSPTTHTTLQIGLTDAAHLGSTITGVNAGGQIIGTTDRTIDGTDAWVFSPTTNVSLAIGLTDPAHTAADGSSTNSPQLINDAGQVAGVANRYIAGQPRGQDAWVYSPTTHLSHVIGLTDAAHTDANGSVNNTSLLQNQAGTIVGTSFVSFRTDTWLYSPATNATTLIGLPGSGSYENQPQMLTESGFVVGYLGRTSWLYSPVTNTTRQIGIYDSRHAGHEVAEYSNLAGMVAGYAYSEKDGGQDAWVYNPVTDVTVEMLGSLSSQGDSYSDVSYLGEDGTVFGYYYAYGVDDIATETAFRWTIADGFQSLGDLVTGGLQFSGGANLGFVEDRNSAGQIAGSGNIPGGLAYLLTPTSVPEPSSLAVVAMVLTSLAGRRRKANHRDLR